MAERVTVNDVRRAFENHINALDALDITYPGRLVLTEGEGELIAYRINTIADGQSGHDHPPIGDDYLGNTARDAYRTLTERTNIIYSTVRAMKESGLLAVAPCACGGDCNRQVTP